MLVDKIFCYQPLTPTLTNFAKGRQIDQMNLDAAHEYDEHQFDARVG
jgi:hypothetical protein